MKLPYPSLTSEWHNKPYDAINPRDPALSHHGETVIVTGGGSGIGSIRRMNMLEETAEEIREQFPDCGIQTFAADVTSVDEMKVVAQKIGAWDVLIHSAGAAMPNKTIVDTDPDTWWRVIEINYRGLFVVAHCLLPVRNTSAKIVVVSAAMVNLHPSYPTCHGGSAYISSKLAQIRFLEHVAAENPDVFTVAVHPGIIATEIMDHLQLDKSVIDNLSLDHIDLPAYFFVWVTSDESRFLRGKFCYANWDVGQLKAQAKEIEGGSLLTSNVVGWPYEAKA